MGIRAVSGFRGRVEPCRASTAPPTRFAFWLAAPAARSDNEFDGSAHAKAARSYAAPDLLCDKVTPSPSLQLMKGGTHF
jgi:hypothetical protein